MTTTGQGSQFTLSFIGAEGGWLSDELGTIAAVNRILSPDTVSGHLVIDGQSGIDVDASSIQQILDRGSLVAIVNPTPAQVSLMKGIAKAGPAGAALLFGLKQHPSGKGYRVFHLASGTVTQKDNTGSPSKTPVQLGSQGQIANAVAAALTESLIGPDLSGLYAPANSFAGTVGSQSTITWQSQMPWCDKKAPSAYQTCISTMNADFYVYWVNGVQSQYYAVIARYYPSFTAGTPVTPPTSSGQGFFQIRFNLNSEISDSNGNSIPGALLKGRSPASSSAPVTTSLGLSMMLYANGQNGPANIPFTAQMNDPGQYTDWAVEDLTAETSPAWEIYQLTGWNIYQNNPDDVSNEWAQDNLYKDSNNVVAMPSESFGSLQSDLVAAWEFHSDELSNQLPQCQTPPSFPVTFSGNWVQQTAYDHAVPGCLQNETHVGWGGVSYTFTFDLDLGTVAAYQNMSGN